MKEAKHTSRYFAASVKMTTLHTAINYKGMLQQARADIMPKPRGASLKNTGPFYPLEYALSGANMAPAMQLLNFENNGNNLCL